MYETKSKQTRRWLVILTVLDKQNIRLKLELQQQIARIPTAF